MATETTEPNSAREPSSAYTEPVTLNTFSSSSSLKDLHSHVSVAKASRMMRHDQLFKSISKSQAIMDFFPDTTIVEDVMKKLNQPNSFLKNGQWDVLPISTEEHYVLEWLSAIYDECMEVVYTRNTGQAQRYFSQWGDKSMPDNSQPDALIFEQQALSVPEGDKPFFRKLPSFDPNWAQVIVPIECKSSAKKSDDSIKQLCDRSRRVFAAQPHRCHSFGLAVAGLNLVVVYFDRQGIIKTEPRWIIRIFVNIMAMSHAELGFCGDYEIKGDAVHTTIQGQHGVNEIRCITVLHAPTELVGRCTTLYRGIWKNKQVILKESYQDVSRTHEAEIINAIHRNKHEGSLHIPTIIDYEDDKEFRPEQARLSNSEDLSRHRLRRRIVFKEELIDVHRGSRPEALLIAIDGALKGIEACISAGIIHGDISEANIMLSSDQTRGYLNDFDLARYQGDSTACFHCSGTPQFMSLRVLKSVCPANKVNDRYIATTHADDIESVFWVLVWVACIYDGPSHILTSHVLLGWKDKTLNQILEAKERFIKDFEKKGINLVSFFYRPLKPTILKFKKVVFDKKNDDVGEVIEELKKTIESGRQSLKKGGLEFENIELTKGGIRRI